MYNVHQIHIVVDTHWRGSLIETEMLPHVMRLFTEIALKVEMNTKVLNMMVRRRNQYNSNTNMRN